MKLLISYVDPGAGQPDWIHVHPNDAVEELPHVTEAVERIMVDNVLERYELEYLPFTLRAWWEHPHVTVKTLMAVAGSRSAGRAIAPLIRQAGWGIVHPYSLQYLALDRWPLNPTGASSDQSGALCRAIK